MKHQLFPVAQIKARYDAALPSFADSFRIHYCIRLYRATGEGKYLEEIKHFLDAKTADILKKLNTITNLDDYQITLAEPIRGTILRNPIEYSRVVRRQAYYRKNPKLKFYFDSIADLYFLYDFRKYLGKYADELKKSIAEYKKYAWQNEFITKEHLLIHPVLLTNCAYQLFEMGMIDSLDSLENIIVDSFGPHQLLSNEKAFDQIYTYTHIIINESRFYQQFLTTAQVDKYSWILDFFINNYDSYKDLLNLDLLIEIAICFYLCKKENPIEVQILEKLFTYYDSDAGYLRKDPQSTLQDMEHAHSIFLIYLLRPNKLHTV